jgi:hypothetical protein
MVRDKKGRFAKGNGGGPGRKPRATEDKYRDLMLSVITPDHWLKIVTKAIEQAERGDSTARKWLADYLIGPPVERKEISGTDAGPIIFEVVYDK